MRANLPNVWVPITCTGPDPLISWNLTGESENLTFRGKFSTLPLCRRAMGMLMSPALPTDSTWIMCSSPLIAPSPRKIWHKNIKNGFAVLTVMIMKRTIFWDLIQLKFTDVSGECNALILWVKEQAMQVTSNKHSIPSNKTWAPIKACEGAKRTNRSTGKSS